MCVPYSPRKTKTIALCQIDIKILVTVGTLFQFDRNSGGLVLFLSSGHVFGTGDVLVVCNTAVLVHLQGLGYEKPSVNDIQAWIDAAANVAVVTEEAE